MSYNYKATGLLIAVGCIQDFPGWIFIGYKNEKFNWMNVREVQAASISKGGGESVVLS